MMRPLNTDAHRCCFLTEGYWCTPFTCAVCDARYQAAKAAGERPPAINTEPLIPHREDLE